MPNSMGPALVCCTHRLTGVSAERRVLPCGIACDPKTKRHTYAIERASLC